MLFLHTLSHCGYKRDCHGIRHFQVRALAGVRCRNLMSEASRATAHQWQWQWQWFAYWPAGIPRPACAHAQGPAATTRRGSYNNPPWSAPRGMRRAHAPSKGVPDPTGWVGACANGQCDFRDMTLSLSV